MLLLGGLSSLLTHLLLRQIGIKFLVLVPVPDIGQKRKP